MLLFQKTSQSLTICIFHMPSGFQNHILISSILQESENILTNLSPLPALMQLYQPFRELQVPSFGLQRELQSPYIVKRALWRKECVYNKAIYL